MKKAIKYLIVIFCIALFIAFTAYTLWLRQGRSLSTELIPTAEALIQNSLPLPSFIVINPHPGGNLAPDQRMCLSILGRGLLKSGERFTEFRVSIAFNTFLYINNRSVSPAETSYPLGGFNSMYPGPENGTVYLCYNLDLEKGVHLGEVTTKNSSGTELSYKWAFYVQ